MSVRVIRATNVQERVQRAVLQLIDETARANPRAVAALCPRTDRRDLVRAVEILVADGMLEPAETDSYPVELLAVLDGCLRLTDDGRRRLAAPG